MQVPQLSIATKRGKGAGTPYYTFDASLFFTHVVILAQVDAKAFDACSAQLLQCIYYRMAWSSMNMDKR